jgi:hypothetical protein
MIRYNKFHPDLLKYLDLKDKLYSIEHIKAALLCKNKLNSKKIYNTYINLDNEGYALFFNATPAVIPNVQIKALLSLIQTNFVINNDKPSCAYYEYTQKPVDVLILNI